jgi:hypothetical protein
MWRKRLDLLVKWTGSGIAGMVIEMEQEFSLLLAQLPSTRVGEDAEDLRSRSGNTCDQASTAPRPGRRISTRAKPSGILEDRAATRSHTSAAATHGASGSTATAEPRTTN